MEYRFNFGRLVLPVSRKVMLMDNGVAFRDNPNIDHFLAEGCGPVGSSFKQSLATLELKAMKKALGDLLSDSQIQAILERRDGILELCEKENPDWALENILQVLQPEG